MTEQAPESLIEKYGFHPIMGGAPEGDTPDTPEPEAPEVQETDKADTESTFTDSFKPDDLPEEARGAYEKAYNEMRADYTRKTQEIAEQRKAAEEWQQFGSMLSNPETQAQALAALGLELEDEEGEPLGPDEEMAQRLALLEQDKMQQQEAQQASQEEERTLTYLGQQLKALEQKEGREFSDEEAEIIAHVALGTPSDTGLPNIDRAYQLLTNSYTGYSERQKKAPRPLGGGRSASKEIDLSTREGKLTAAAEAAEAVMTSQ